MSETLARIRALVAGGTWRPTHHALRRIQERDLLLQDALDGLETGELVEDYPGDPRGPSVLVFSVTSTKLPLHAVWGIAANDNPMVSLVTVYIPNPSEWLEDNKTRRKT